MIVLRAVFALALMLNGIALPPAAAGDMPDAAAHGGHHDPEHRPDQAPAQNAADSPAGDCCDGMVCDCGCTAAQAMTVQAAATRGIWLANPPDFASVDQSISSSPFTAPFRPPA